jgi:hypothetical protein
MGADAHVPRTMAESLPREHPLEAYLSEVISQDGVEGELMQFCVFRLARSSTFRNYIRSEPRFRALLTEEAPEVEVGLM